MYTGSGEGSSYRPPSLVYAADVTPPTTQLEPLFERLVAEPRSLGAFEDYARAVEEAVREGDPGEVPALASQLASHLGKLPALAESRLDATLDQLARELLDSVEFDQLRPGRALASALESARRELDARFPRIQGMAPSELVTLHKHEPSRLLDLLDELDAPWLAPLLRRTRSLLRDAREVPGDPALDARLAALLSEIGAALLDRTPPAHAELALRAALLFDPGAAHARAGLGVLARRYGRGREAELQLRAALDRDPSLLAALAGLTEALLEAGRPDEAEEVLQRLLAAHPEEPEGHLLAGQLALFRGRPVEALPSLLEALDLDPDRARASRALAATYAALGHRELSEAYHQAAWQRTGHAQPPEAGPEVQGPPAPLDPSLLRPPPAPPSPGPARPDLPADVGPLTRDEAFRRLLEHCIEDGELRAEDLGVVLKARVGLRISRAAFDALLDEAIARSVGTRAFDPGAYFEELRRQAWRDGYLSPSEREILEATLEALGLDRRRRRRDD